MVLPIRRVSIEPKSLPNPRAPGWPRGRRRTIVIHKNHSENNRMVRVSDSIYSVAEARLMHPLIAPPKVGWLGRQHLGGMIGLMILLWLGFMVAVVYKGMTPKSGYIITQDR